MGEIFERTIPGEPLDWTGERLTTAVSGQIEIEHLHRYFLAREWSRGCDVLDIACGEGYGSALLAQVATSVVGVDVSDETVAHAQATYEAPNLQFKTGDARVIPMPDDSVDRLVSFETLEHFYDHDAFMAEAARVLRPGGLLIISSPERDIYSPGGSSANQYHVRELSRLEFEALLQKTFPHFHILAQRPMIGSAMMLDDGDAPTRTRTFEKRGPSHYESSTGLPRAPYLVAIASMTPIESVASSLFIDNSEIGATLDYARAYPELAKGFAAERDHVAALQMQIAQQQAEITRHEGTIGQIETMTAELELLRQQCEAMRVAARRAAGVNLADPAMLSGDVDEWRNRYAALHTRVMKTVRKTPRIFRKYVRNRLLGSAGEP